MRRFPLVCNNQFNEISESPQPVPETSMTNGWQDLARGDWGADIPEQIVIANKRIGFIPGHHQVEQVVMPTGTQDVWCSVGINGSGAMQRQRETFLRT